MMKRTFINPTNVVKITQILLELEKDTLQEKYQLDAESFVFQLKKAFLNYKNLPKDDQEIKKWNTIDNIEQAIKNLIDHVNEFITLLTPEAQQQIEKKFNQPP